MGESTSASATSGTRTTAQTVVLGPEDAGQRLDKVLARLLPTMPRSHLFRLLRKGEVRLNGKRVSGEARVAEGDSLRIPPHHVAPVEVAVAARPVPQRLRDLVEAAVILEDDRLLVLDKPSGVAVHGGSGQSFGVIEALRASRPKETLELVHRLDRDTSGCLLVARKRSTLRSFHAMLREDAFDKRYLTLLRGKWELGAKRIDAPLDTEGRVGGERTVRVDPMGKPSASEFRVVQFFGNLATLVEVQLLTGRTHQIRVHARYAGHPVAGDDKYGDEAFNAQMRELGLGRLFLHAHNISYVDPDRHVDVSASAPLPADLKEFLGRLEEASASGRLRPRGGARLESPVRARGLEPPRPVPRRKVAKKRPGAASGKKKPALGRRGAAMAAAKRAKRVVPAGKSAGRTGRSSSTARRPSGNR
jgi:23S rRNA pseudouridine955/2504/2580 synthase